MKIINLILLISLQMSVAIASNSNTLAQPSIKAQARCESVFSGLAGYNKIYLHEDLRLLRASYVQEVNSLASLKVGLKNEGVSEEVIARKLHDLRRALGVKYKNLTPPENRENIYTRNLLVYGDKLGPTVEWLREHGSSWDEISESATRTGGKDLGL